MILIINIVQTIIISKDTFSYKGKNIKRAAIYCRGEKIKKKKERFIASNTRSNRDQIYLLEIENILISSQKVNTREPRRELARP